VRVVETFQCGAPSRALRNNRSNSQMQTLPNNPTVPPGPPPATPAAGFAPVTPVGDTPLLSLVPPIQQGDSIRHPDPILQPAVARQPLPTTAQIPVAPVRRRRPVTPLIQLAQDGALESALRVAPVIPGGPAGAQPVNAGPAAYGLQPTTFPFWSAPAFNLVPPAPVMTPPPLPVQTFVAYVTLLPQQPQWQPQPAQPVFFPQAAPQFFQPQAAPQAQQPQPYVPMPVFAPPQPPAAWPPAG
jgi:hypothetical protein